MTENYIVSLVVWIILYASFWLTKHNPVSTAFRRRECHTGFLAKWLEKTIFPFRWYGSRPTYEYAIGLLLLCCILFTVSLHISVAHFDLPQIYFDTVYEHCRFTFISGICAVCGYYCWYLISDRAKLDTSLKSSVAILNQASSMRLQCSLQLKTYTKQRVRLTLCQLRLLLQLEFLWVHYCLQYWEMKLLALERCLMRGQQSRV